MPDRSRPRGASFVCLAGGFGSWHRAPSRLTIRCVMGASGDGIDCLEGYGGPLESVTGVAGPVLLAATVPDLARGDVLAGRYQIEAVIGSGGSGRVLRAFDRVTRTAVALKILRPEYAADSVWNERFSRELRVGRQIQHPNVCRVYDIGDSDGHKFLSMELATGGTIRSQLAPGAAPRSVDDRIADARAIIQGVAALHAAGIVHRDLKPENILRAADGRLLVSDFGLATDPGAGPATTIMIGTPRYMAPEVVMGDPATIRSDVWALGVVMHEILSGERPNRSIIKRRRRMYTPPEVGSPRERRLVELCARCSEEDPEARPASAVELRREFEAAVSGRRIGSRSFKKQIAWAAVAATALASLGLVRNRWTNSAVASSSQAAAISGSSSNIQVLGNPRDWGRSSQQLAAFDGEIHCVAGLGREAVGVVWGEPRRAETVFLSTGKRMESVLQPDTFIEGCPQPSPDGRSLLFERKVDGASQIFVSDSLDGRFARPLVRGSAPRWFPNGQEFSFILDSRHAAIFSLPTREMTVVSDGSNVPLSVAEQAVDAEGRRLAVLYTTESFDRTLVVHSLPTLEVVSRSRLPEWSGHLRFASGGSVLFTAPGLDGSRRMVGADSSLTTFANVAAIQGFDIQQTIETSRGQLVISRKRTIDLWMHAPNGETQRLTSDGQSVRGNRSAAGMLTIQRHLPDGREVIVIKRPNGQEEQLSYGTADLTPSFSPDSHAVIYSRFKSGEIVECAVDSHRCHVLHTDRLVPAYPSMDSSGKWIAYITSLGASRIRLVEREGHHQERDLGPAQACGPVWSGGDKLWAVAAASAHELLWVEIDTHSGHRTGASRNVKVSGGEECPLPSDVAAPGGAGYVFPLAKDTSQVRLVATSPSR